MSYQLSWLGFQEYARGRDTSGLTTMPANAGGESRARTYVWRRFKRCHDPLLRRSLFPRTGCCEAAVYHDEAHWDAVFCKWVRLRTLDDVAADATEVTLLGPHGPDDEDDPWSRVADTAPDTVAAVLGGLEVDSLREAIEAFNTEVPFGPEIQQAMLSATYNVEYGYAGDFFDSVKDWLVEQLPDSFNRDASGRQRLKRALDRSRAYVRAALRPPDA